jgi:hypothetical protein
MGVVDVALGHIDDVQTAPAGRKCKTWGCKTTLSRYNLNNHCSICRQRNYKKENRFEPLQD